MNLSEQLAQAVFQAQGRIDELAAHNRARLAAARDELGRSEAFSLDRDILEQQCLDLTRQTAALRDEIEALESERERLRGALREKLSEARQRLADAYRQAFAEHLSAFYARELDSVLAAFAAELKASGFDLETATPAQRRQRVSALKPLAQRHRLAALRRAEQVSADLSTQSVRVERQAALDMRRKQVGEETRDVLSALLSHSRSGTSMSIVESIMGADADVLERLRREVLEPMLNDASLERRLGLGAGDDPLQPLRAQSEWR